MTKKQMRDWIIERTTNYLTEGENPYIEDGTLNLTHVEFAVQAMIEHADSEAQFQELKAYYLGLSKLAKKRLLLTIHRKAMKEYSSFLILNFAYSDEDEDEE